jgi:hypothetical protein
MTEKLTASPGEVDRHARTGVDAIERPGCGLDADAGERQAVNLGQHEALRGAARLVARLLRR